MDSALCASRDVGIACLERDGIVGVGESMVEICGCYGCFN